MSAKRAGEVAPDDISQTVASMWAQVLQIHDVADDQDFFDAGGRSLDAVRLLVNIHSALGVQISLEGFHRCGNLADLIELVKLRYLHGAASQAKSPGASKDSRVVLSLQQELRIERTRSAANPLSKSRPSAILLKVNGPIVPSAVMGALEDVGARHDALRLHVPDLDPSRAAILPPSCITENIVHFEGAIPDSFLVDPFDFQTGPLMRVALSSIGRHLHFLAIVVDTMVCDKFSSDILVQDFVHLYNNRLGRVGLPAPLRSSFWDFAKDEVLRTQGTAGERLKQFWFSNIRQFGLEAPLCLPGKSDSSVMNSGPAESASVRTVPVDVPSAPHVNESFSGLPFSPLHLLVTACLLAARTYSDSPFVGAVVPYLNRDFPGSMAVVGQFSQGLNVGVEIDRDTGVDSVLDQVYANWSAARNHVIQRAWIKNQYLLLNRIDKPRFRPWLFCDYTEEDSPVFQFGDSTLEVVPTDGDSVKLHPSVEVTLTRKLNLNYELEFRYAESAYAPEVIEEFSDRVTAGFEMLNTKHASSRAVGPVDGTTNS